MENVEKLAYLYLMIRGRQFKKVIHWKLFLSNLTPQRSISLNDFDQNFNLEAQKRIEVYSTNLLYGNYEISNIAKKRH